MTCGEFKHDTARMTLADLSQASQQVLGHASECQNCGEWLKGRRILEANLRSLASLTAGREAGPEVERALLQAFLQRHGEALPATDRLTPLAWRLSRIFEIGAYAAVAAAIVVGLFLGVRLWQSRSMAPAAHNQATRPMSSVSAMAAQMTPTNAKPAVAEGPGDTKTASSSEQQRPAALRHESHRQQRAESRGVASSSMVSADEDGYTLMFCDPQTCFDDAQVVRLQLEPEGNLAGQNMQPETADIVVGYDGVIHAVRIVN